MYRITIFLNVILMVTCTISYAQMDSTIDLIDPNICLEESGESIHQNINGHDVECPLICILRAFKLDNNGKQTTEISLKTYRGAALFIPKEIEVSDHIEIEKETWIEILLVQNGMFITGKRVWSSVPFILTDGVLDEKATRFMNVIWVFAEKMEFQTKKTHYSVTHPGATISFTRDGIKLDGIIKTEITTPNTNEQKY
jgi:hypothetical protein